MGQLAVRSTGIAAGCSILAMDAGGAKTRVGAGGDLTSGGPEGLTRASTMRGPSYNIMISLSNSASLLEFVACLGGSVFTGAWWVETGTDVACNEP